MVTIRDVAKLANVSVSTASRALRDEGYVSDKTKAAVLKAADSLNYIPDRQAKGLRSKKSHIIGIIVSDINNYFYTTVLSSIEAELKKQGYMILLSHSNETGELEKESLEVLLSSRVDGIIFTPVDDGNRKILEQIQRNGIPVLQLYRKAYEEFDSLVIDDEYGSYLATRHLINNGHRDILLLTVDSPISPNRGRGYETAFAEEKLPLDEKFIAELSLTQDPGESIRKKIQELSPTAIIAGTNTFGLNAYAESRNLGLNIPDDISLVLFDDVPWISILDITCISQPISIIARTALGILMERINELENSDNTVIPEFSNHLKIQPSLISRSSVKKKI